MATASPADEPTSVAPPATRPWLLAVTVTALGVLNVLNHLLVDDRLYVPANLLAAGTLLIVARRRGLTSVELGIPRRELDRGLRLGVAASVGIGVVVATVVAIGLALVPSMRSASSASLSTPELVYELLVRIPLGTALTEELLFRSVLLGVLLRQAVSPARAAAWSAVLFGLWHVLPTLDPASPVSGGPVAALGVVVVTGVAGLGLAWLRLRARHVVAPVLVHASLNGAALLTASLGPGGG